MERDIIMNPWPKQYSATVFWGARQHPVSGKVRLHHGVDVPMPGNTPLIAGADGVIVDRGHRAGLGITLEIQYSNGMRGIYHHLNKYGEFNIGDDVAPTDVVAYSGKTGRTTGAHLHYELWNNRTSIDPLRHIVRRVAR
jgi:murein DD-endopeptidase MepM/ murein hydrolase activator NlpD